MPPSGFPVWLWTILGVALPVLYQQVLSKLPGIVKFALAWGITAVVVVLVGIVFLGYSPGEFLTAFLWVIASMQAVYSLFVKPYVRRQQRKFKL